MITITGPCVSANHVAVSHFGRVASTLAAWKARTRQCTVRDRGRVASDEGQTSFRWLCGRSAPSGFSMRFTSTRRSPPYPISTGTNFSYQDHVKLFLKLYSHVKC